MLNWPPSCLPDNMSLLTYQTFDLCDLHGGDIHDAAFATDLLITLCVEQRASSQQQLTEGCTSNS